MSDMTTIATPRATRDKLAALTPKGSALADTIDMLIADHETQRSIERLALERRLAEAREDPESVARAERIVSHLVDLAAFKDSRR